MDITTGLDHVVPGSQHVPFCRRLVDREVSAQNVILLLDSLLQGLQSLRGIPAVINAALPLVRGLSQKCIARLRAFPDKGETA